MYILNQKIVGYYSVLEYENIDPLVERSYRFTRNLYLVYKSILFLSFVIFNAHLNLGFIHVLIAVLNCLYTPN